ncbi:hypothetical protein BS17DRAFT_836668 [Gyrodon lividus]|nr:hypothetical protein BS17DRAFT_836668 [Gyrodon lividus]
MARLSDWDISIMVVLANPSAYVQEGSIVEIERIVLWLMEKWKLILAPGFVREAIGLGKLFTFPHPTPAGGMSSLPVSFSPSHRITQAPSCEETLFSAKVIPSSNEGLVLQCGGPASEALLHKDSDDQRHANHTLSKGSGALRYWCYALHAFLAVIHVILVAMLFGHPEHRVTVPTDSSILTVGLSAFLQAFYTIYTAILVLITQRLAVSAALARRRKLTIIHDMRGAWSGIGAAINGLWQQTKVSASPSTTLVILTYLSCISGLHIVSSSVIQFQVFNNTVTDTVQSRSTWPAPSVNISNLEWLDISLLVPMLPTLSTLSANGLTGSTLYDIPLVDHHYTMAMVNGTTVGADCSLLSNLSAVTFVKSDDSLNVTVSGFGQMLLSPGVTTGMELGNLTGNIVLQGDAIAKLTAGIACSLNTTTSSYHLDMASGQVVLAVPTSNDPLPWTLWSPGQSTELSTALNPAFMNVLQVDFCQQMQLSGSVDSVCGFISIVDVYIMSLLGIGVTTNGALRTIVDSESLITLERRQLENAIAQVAAELIWLAGEVGASGGGFPRIEGESSATQQVLELRLNVNTTPHESFSFSKVAIGLCASIILLALVLCMLRNPPKAQLSRVTSAGVLELMWISAHSLSLRNHLKGIKNSSLDKLRAEGMIDVTECGKLQDGTLPMIPEFHTVKLEESAVEEHQSVSSSFIGWFPLYRWSYMLHGMPVALHVALLALLINHPEHHVVIPLDNGVMTTGLSVFLQAFYTLYTAGLVFVTQRLALSGFISRRQYLTAVHDVSVLHIASSTVMQFTAFNSTTTASIQSTVIWSNQSVDSDLSGVNWMEAVAAVPSMNLLSGLGAYGLSNNTPHDTLTTTDPFFINATASCGLLSNLSYGAGFIDGPNILVYHVNFSVSGFGSGTFILSEESARRATNTSFTNINIDGSIDSTISVDVNLTSSGSPSSLTTYFVACSVEAQTVLVTLDVQGGRLNPSPSQTQTDPLQPWMLWSPGGSANLTTAILTAFQFSSFSGCQLNGYAMCINVTEFGSPYQLEQAITQMATESIWLAGQAGKSRGGFQRTSGESQVIQLVTQWRLNVNTIPRLVLFVMEFFLVGRPSRRSASVSGVTVLETLWIAAHSETLYERMADIDDASLDNLRAAGMFGIRIADVKAERSIPSVPGSDDDTLLE